MSHCTANVGYISLTQTYYQIYKVVSRQRSSGANKVEKFTKLDLCVPQTAVCVECLNIVAVQKTVEYTLTNWIENCKFIINDFITTNYSDPMKGDLVNINVVNMIGSEFCVATEDARKLYEDISHNINEKRKVVASFKNVKLLTPLFLNMSICQLYGQFEEDDINKYVDIVDIDENNKKMLSIQIKRAKHYFKNPESFNKIVNTSFGEYNE